MHEQTLTDEHITLTEAAKLAPGRPSTNCLWRWCRRGVKARGGERVRLQHLRIGGKIFTTLRWLETFGRQLAEADARYFDLCESAARAAAQPATRRARRSPATTCPASPNPHELEQAERELEEAGI